MCHSYRFALLLAAGALGTAVIAGEEFRLVRSLSGASGKVEGSKFVFDQVRNRFLYPQDKALIVYFEWEGPVGTHSLTATWKQPDGRVVSISPDVKIESTSRELSCYWTYVLAEGLASGVWTVEVRIDGQPAGSHVLEIVAPEPPRQERLPAQPKLPTLDEIFKAASQSMVWVRKLDAQGRHVDTASGFVIGKNRVATAFQAVDAASKLEIEFAGGRKAVSDELLTWSRNGDWALIKADTAGVRPLESGDPKRSAVGERLIVFNIESGARAIGGVDISGQRDLPAFGPRIQISPSLAPESAGGPLLDTSGRVVGILGGSVSPGTRSGSRNQTAGMGVWNDLYAKNAAVPISFLSDQVPEKVTALHELTEKGVLTLPVQSVPEFIYGVTALEIPKRPTDPVPHESSEFSRKDPQVWVFSMWLQKGKVSKGMLSGKVYDQQNRLRVTVTPKKTSLSSTPLRSGFSFVPAPLAAGIYRIDVLWDEQPVWRTFIRITD